MRSLPGLVLPGLALAVVAHAGDLVIRQRTTTSAGGQTTTRQETQYARGDLLAIDATDTRTIVDVAAKTMTIADKSRRQYFTMTFDDMRRQAEAVQGRKQRMPPDVKRMLEEMLGGGAPITLSATGARETIAGHQASEHRLSGGPFRGAIWTTAEIALPDGVRRWRELAAASTAATGPARPLAQALAQASGVPLRTSITATVGQGTVTTATEVLEVRTAPPPPDVLTVPPGFTRVAPPPFE